MRMVKGTRYSETLQEFWRWFTRNEGRLFDMEKERERLLGELGKELSHIHRDLTFEFGSIVEGRREFVISAGGMQDAFPAVEALVQTAPSLPRWHILPFRQRRRDVGTFSIHGMTLAPSVVRFTLHGEGARAGIVLYMPGYRKEEHSRYITMAFMMLDAFLGEYDVEMKLGSIDVRALEPGAAEGAEVLDRLPGVFDAYLQSFTN